MNVHAYDDLRNKRIAEVKVDKVQQALRRHERTEIKRKREQEREVVYICREWWMEEGD
jgi:hypothetical protein